ncbi:TM0106 family RecB-like putative nuclease [Paraburkholderia sprentiae WSM5005]|uniref:TM0106 family RecB-like putative nuclease n=1 Tax=Paraburkholderia sprentiae WSM5005 TaxID=754502 RepID=A0A1I9YCN3_9BURK|nr:TM0106 family RecB-like putative nuclease [Paraburkholderia sprentiae]APA84066.1 TM0106 family RecB-like putative nuclease [Paraburkholderia sprentiae WSM5005]
MLQLNGARVYSASDVVSFLECEHSTTLALIDLVTPLPRNPEDEQLALVQERGLVHEKAYLATLTAQHRRVVDINKHAGKSIQSRVEATLLAMRNGYDVIYQAAFLDDNLLGYADFLVKVAMPSTLGDYSYEPIDTKLALSSRSKFLVQLCFYSHLLAKAQGRYPERMRVVLGSNREAAYRCADYRYYFDTALARFLARVERESAAAGSYPDPCDKCSQCHWSNLCEKQRIKDDHLCQVAGIARVHIRKLKDAGVATLAALAAMKPGKPIEKIAPATVERLRSQAELQHKFRKDGVRRHLLLQKEPGDTRLRGLERLPKPSPGDIFFDMEGNPLETGGLEYLFGVWEVDQPNGYFRSFWAHNRAEEKLAFEQFMDYVDARLAQYPEAHIYHYAPYEPTALKKLMSVHGTREASVDNLLRRGALIDLYAVVREALRVSEPSYSIKYIERFYRGVRAGTVTNAGASIVFYERWKVLANDREKSVEAEQLLQDIEDYNRDDVESTYELREWLLELQAEAAPASNAPEVVAPALEPVATDPDTIRRQALVESILQPLPLKEAHWTVADRYQALVAHLVFFHEREAKPEWWAMYARRDMTDAQLIEDAECLGGLVPDPSRQPVLEKESFRYFYNVPSQETKLRTGVTPADTRTMNSLSNLQVDMQARSVSFTVGKKTPFSPHSVTSIGPGKPLRTDAHREALEHFATCMHSHTAGYRAVQALLRREVPRISGARHGVALIDDDLDLLPQVIRVVEGMDETCLFIQGPPGAGKTYTGSHLLVELLRKKKRVGVTSNSHQAINNLLQAVEKRALTAKVRFSGMKKSNEDDTCHGGSMIVDVKNDKDIVSGGADLVAGTSWLFAKKEMRDQLDYLFVDEAGQMALANLVAVGMSARNIVLLGDQMQLGQPSKGMHPSRSGESTLEYLLDGAATIPADKGIFLKTTYRMHHDVCQFISDAVYDGRLMPAPETAKRLVDAPFEGEPAAPMTGIRYVPVQHDGNAQSSDEEVRKVVDIVNALRKGTRDEDGRMVPITLEDILVVAPYNVQVNQLKRALPTGARVGTVDKFQGQEAHVVILSMATSNADHLPRDIEFLFSKNRLNVAVSRAKALAILVACPDLLTVPCSRPEQMALVNMLCALVYYSERHVTSRGVQVQFTV